VLGREDVDLLVVGEQLAGQRVDLADALDLVAPQADAIGGLAVGGLHSPAHRRAPGSARAARMLSLRS
jgi:hypothetical protein